MGEPFDVEQIYDTEISPLMEQIIAICKAHRIPMIASFIYKIYEDESFDACTTYLNECEILEFQRAIAQIYTKQSIPL